MQRNAYAPWIWLFPAGALLIPFFLLPLAIVIRNSVYFDDPRGSMVAAFTATNYLKVLTDPYYTPGSLPTLCWSPRSRRSCPCW